MSIKSVKEQLDIIAPDLKILEFNEPTATVEQAANAHKVEPCLLYTSDAADE